MNCPKCNNPMSGGAPHCETIKVQMECHWCGHYENEYYTPDEMKVNELTAATGASLTICRKVLEENDYHLENSVAALLPRSTDLKGDKSERAGDFFSVN